MPTMTITTKQRRWLKGQVHHLKPVVLLGQAGLTDGVVAEIDGALAHHELIKVKVNAGDRDLREAMVAEIATRTGSDLIDRIGNMASFYRANPDKKAPMQLPVD
jgi:RNA-binding protein